RVISINLKLEGMDVVEAHDGATALEKIEQEKPDCVVLDIMLPKVSGWEIIKQIKSNPELSEIPVVMVTAKTSERDQLRGLGAGAAKYIMKPFSPMALTEAIKSVLKPQIKEDVARERREAIERLQLSTLRKISDILISTYTLDDLLSTVAERLMDLFDIPACALIISNEEPELHAFRKTTGKSSRDTGTSMLALSKNAYEEITHNLVSNRHPLKISEISGLEIEDIFPGFDLSDGFLFPLFERNEFLGCIAVASKSRLSLSPDEEDLLSTIANQVAAAIARAKLHEQLKEDELIHRRLLQQTITAQEAERRRLAAEIHDGVLQCLVGLSYRLQAIHKKLPAEADDSVCSELREVEEQLMNSLNDLRELLLGLRPPMLDDMGLLPALESLHKNFGIKNHIQTTLNVPENPPELSRDSQINIFRIVQEALNNIEKHASASHVTTGLELTSEKLFITIRDDGKGFSMKKRLGKPGHLGIASMKERAELLGGKFQVRSEKGRGTVVTLEFPLRQILEV
ncbi:MAG: response regulator, partial [Actinomycetota bacterium]|nr:response regulator [Actinomycetota bacterium]